VCLAKPVPQADRQEFARAHTMNRIVLEESILEKLRDLDEVELCDRSGKRIGHFVSDDLFRRLLYDWANAQVSDEELDRRRQQPGGRTLAEIWARLESA
jgi:hypothetical protein